MNAFEEQDYSDKLDFNIWKKLLGYAAVYKKQMITLAIVMVMVAGIDAVFPLLNRYVVDNYIVPGQAKGMGLFIGAYLVLTAVQGVNVWLLIAISGKVEAAICHDIRIKAFEKLQKLSLTYYDRTPTGWIMARVTSDTNRLGQIIAWGTVDTVWGLAIMLLVAVIMFFMNARLALTVLSVVPLLMVISVYFQKRILMAYRKVRKTNSKITAAFSEGIMGARTSKSLIREERNIAEFKELTASMCQSSVKAAVFSAVYMPIVLLLGSIGASLVLWHGGNRVAFGTVSYGTLVAFVNYAIRFFEPVRELARIFAELQFAQASGERVLSLIDTEPDITEGDRITDIYGDFFNPKKDNWPPIKGHIVFENVSFHYKEGEEVLKNFSLEVKPGEKIALVGETGSGKTTIVNLVCRFYEPVEGRILIDGTDYTERSQLWLQSNLGYVLQSPHLFSGTIRENIRYGKLDATDDEIVEAAKLVHAHGFIMELEKGYDTEVGEGGGRLSTGQKQLVSFARAIISNPAIFVLDEATSSVDTHSEVLIQKAIGKVLEGRTSFIIAHRLSTVRNADRILVLHKGEVVEQGAHSELLKKKGRYYMLYTNQFIDEQERAILNR
jgi:ATP-binding cassette subfamily B protein